MKTNGSQSSHIQVDRQTIETALDDEVVARSFPNTTIAVSKGGNEEKVATTVSNAVETMRVVRTRKQQPSTTTTSSRENGGHQETDLLDILDNFLTSNPDNETFAESQMDVSSSSRFVLKVK